MCASVPPSSKDQAHKPTNFKGLKPQVHKLQELKPTTIKLEGFKAQVQNPPSSGPQQEVSRLQSSSSKPTKQWPTTTSLKALKLKFKAHQTVAHNKFQGFKAQVQSPPSGSSQAQASKLIKQWPTTTSFKDLKPKFKPTKR